jgi:3-deoxy-D-manno-octulosonate 8-phosphate phosphatase KdsC-like HAD superfamily phosphatase
MAEDGFTCLRGGGQGAVREFCEAVLASMGIKVLAVKERE